MLFLSSAAALLTSLALNVAKSSIRFGRIKRHLKSGVNDEVEEAVSESLAAAHRSDEDRRLTFLLSDVLRLSSPRPRLRHGMRLALLSRPNLTLNLCILSFYLWLFFLHS